MGKHHLGFGLVAVAALVSALAASAPAQAATSAQPAVASHTVAATETPDGYWTSERMRSAVPGDVLADRAVWRASSTAVGHVARGLEQRVAGIEAKASAQTKAAKPKPNALSTAESVVPHIGKVFFTLGGQNYVCSGNSVAAANKNTVSTAGHCLNEGPGAFATNFTFVPAYDNGAAPYGQWNARSLHAPTQWSNAGDMTYDTGFAVVSPRNGQNLADVVGASGLSFNAARGQTYKAFGYPAASPFTGQKLISCTGPASNDPYNPQFAAQGIPCDMTGGSSGGPWFLGTSSSGYQNTVNSYGYGSRSTVMYGPYWGSVVQSTYQTAASS
ncbi:trypsin-like serine peptidase [Arthrobacter halodurans]|uniref:Serine protease n=1 Tax=Arthrobacter halodurans TaxID=516699 RepID=A0ABV4URA0_9MICC